MSEHTTFKAANDKYVQGFGEKASLALPPARKVSHLGCAYMRRSIL
jgi:hypothetical protein